MKKIIGLTICIIFFGKNNNINAQEPYIEFATHGAIVATNPAFKKQQAQNEKNLKEINRLQVATTALSNKIEKLQERFFKGLSEVSSAISDGLTVKEIVLQTKELYNDVAQLSSYAFKNPHYATFAIPEIKATQKRTLIAYKNATALFKGGEKSLMNAGERRELLNSLCREIQLMRASMRIILQTLHQVENIGFLNMLNPFKKNNYSEIDSRIMKNIIKEKAKK